MVEMLINISNILAPIFYKVLYMSIVGTVLGILIVILTKYFDNKLSAKLKYFIMLIPILFLMIPISKIEVNTNNDFLITSVIEKVETKLSKVQDIDYSNINKKEGDSHKINKESNIMNIQQNHTNINTKSDKTSITFYTILPIIWIVGVGISLIIFVIGNVCLKYKIAKSRKLEDVRIDMILTKCRKRLKITKKIDIKIQNFNISPCIYGIVRPKILLTEEFCKKDNEIIENVFMHELSHYKRKDMITNYLLLIMTSIHWFNPFVYGFYKKIRQEMELATDEIALSKMQKEEKKK